MLRESLRIRCVVALCCAWAAMAAGPPVLAADYDEDLRAIDPIEHIEFFSTTLASRFTGYPGCDGAAEYVRARFEAIGLTNIRATNFQVAVPMTPRGEDGKRPDNGAWLTVAGQEGRRIPLFNLMPNYARTSMTGPDGITGKLIWAGDGYLKDFNGKDVEGSIVLMHFNSMTRWLNAARLGAGAVIFVEPVYPFRVDAEQKYSELPMPIHRYYLRRQDVPALLAAVKGEASPQSPSPQQVESALSEIARLGEAEAGGLADVSGNVLAKMQWEWANVKRISGQIPGIDPQLGEQTIVVFAYYDSTSVVPALSPGAESACGIAALLEIAEFMAKHPPRRTVKFIAAPGHYQALSGVRNYAFDAIYPRRAEAKITGGEPYFFIGLDLSSRHNSLGAFYKGHFYDQLAAKEVELQRAYSEYSGMLLDWADEVTDEEGPAGGLAYQSGIVPQQGRDWKSLVPDLVAFDGEVVSLCGQPAITLATTGDPRNSINTPLDTFENMEPGARQTVGRQAVACAYLIKKTADAPSLPIQRDKIWEKRQAASLFGYAIEMSLLAYMPKVPVANTVAGTSMLTVQQAAKSKSMMGVQTCDYQISNTRGYFEVFGLVKDQQFRVDGFQLSPATGAVSRVSLSQQGGRALGLAKASDRPRASDWSERETDMRLNFFRAASTTIFDLTDPLSLRTLSKSSALTGAANSQLEYLCSFVGQESTSDAFSKPAAVFFTKRDKNVKFTLTHGAMGFQGLLLNLVEDPAAAKAKKEQTGVGYRAIDNENFIRRTAFEIVKDMHALDTNRLVRLEDNGITKAGVGSLHEMARAHIAKAESILESPDDSDYRRYDRFYHNVLMAWGLENRVYPDVRDTATDVVKGLVFYFALLLPFVLFAERLLINYVDIRKKLLAIVVLFIISYLVLRAVHPAFELSRTPIIILDGFLMLVAAIGTIWYLVIKFGIVMEGLRQKLDMIHRADVARAAATMAAFVLGISNMRKRKVRTGLTAITLILLTFTILSFTSFEAMPTNVLDYRSPRVAPYEGVLLRGLSWDPLPEFVTYDMMNFFEVQGLRVAPRSWFVNRNRAEELQIEVESVGERPGQAVINALLGLSPEEKYFSGIDDPKYLHGTWFDRNADDWPFVCILPSRVQEALGIEEREIAEGRAFVRVMGSRKLRVVASIDSEAMFKYEDMDGEALTPADFVAQSFRQGAQAGQAGGSALSATGEMDVETFVHRKSAKQEEEEQYVHMEPDRTIIIPNELNLSLGATVRAIAAGPGRASLAEKTLRPFHQVLGDLLKRVNLAIYAGYTEPETPEAAPSVHRVATRSRMSVGGLKGLLVPILIAALIVFNTMLGAVYERMNEIRTYASVGLAPMHITALFFAESSVFAVMGAMLGYLLGQILSYGLQLFPALTAGMSLNYSSVSAVWSVLLIMAVVLASTAYPARMAGKLSVPDETRKMVIAKPTTDVWEIVFPFTVSSRETLGVMSYLRDYFAGNDEDAVGSFTTADVTFYTEESPTGTSVCIESDVWVAPLDMGVSQRVKIASVPDEDEKEISYLCFTITRKSGEFQTWHRMNMGFLKDLRKQLLIWRLVTPEAKARLTEEARELLAEAPPVGVS